MTTEETKEVLKEAIEALEKAEHFEKMWNDHMDKYRWHDIRKNPHDLPNILEQVLVKAQIGIEEYEYGTASRVIGNDNGWTCFGYVVAWKRIDPYEV